VKTQRERERKEKKEKGKKRRERKNRRKRPPRRPLLLQLQKLQRSSHPSKNRQQQKHPLTRADSDFEEETVSNFIRIRKLCEYFSRRASR